MTRDEQISHLRIITGFSYEYLKSLDPKALDKLYRERAEQR